MKKLICMGIFLCVMPYTLWAMDSPKSKWAIIAEHTQALGLGAATGTIEVLVDQPLIGIKNWLQLPYEKRAKIALTPRYLYTGLMTNVAGMAPATALQIAVNTGLEAAIEGEDLPAKLMRASAAGVASSVVANPIELIILQQHITQARAPAVVNAVVDAAGMRTLLSRAITLTAAREGFFAPGYLVVYPMIKELIEEKLENKTVAIVGSGMLTGGIIAVLTHPLDTIKTRLQADYTKAEIATIRDACRSLYYEIDEKTGKKIGWRSFYKGGAARATRAIIAIPLMAKTYEVLKECTQSQP